MRSVVHLTCVELSTNVEIPMIDGSYFFELRTGKVERGTKDSAALDVFYSGVMPLEIGDKPVTIPTGVKTAFSPGLVAFLKEKSGLALKGLELKGGVIDADYRDEWIVIARYPMVFDLRGVGDESGILKTDPRGVLSKDWKPFILSPGMKVAQFVLFEIPKVRYYSLDGATLILKEDIRGGGFGSTGK